MSSNRCRHYRLETELLLVPGAGIVLRVPTRRCELAERMITRIADTETGQEVASKLTFLSAISPPASTTDLTASLPDSTLLRAILGPDLEPIHHADCVVQRCLEICTPGYISLLGQYGLSTESEQEIEQGCIEDTNYSEDTLDPHFDNKQ